MTLKQRIRNLAPKWLIQLYHWTLAQLAAWRYGFPSEKMVIIGVTGTSGKSTTCEIIWRLLQSTGNVVGLASGIHFFDGQEDTANNTKMTMVGRFQLQRLLRRMVANNCRYAVVEVTSLGISQYRHLGIHFDITLVTNFWSEHDEAHGGFENYRLAKANLIKSMMKRPVKKITGAPNQRIAITNADDQYHDFFGRLPADTHLAYSLHHGGDNIILAEQVRSNTSGSDFVIQDTPIHINLLGEHNVYNALAALTIARALGFSLTDCAKALREVRGIPGRLEFIDQGQNFSVIIDYAFEPKAMRKLYDVITALPHHKIIHVLGTTGGGRDAKRGSVLGHMAAEFADYVVATDEDPYDDNPLDLIQRVIDGALSSGKELDKNLFVEVNRRDGIAKGISLAQPGDVVLITGKGSEGTMAVANTKLIPWDDRQVVRELLQK